VLRHARYRCSECGLDSSSFLWQCPGCQSWETLRAIAALEFLPRAARPGAGDKRWVWGMGDGG
jgi:predicted ATP-dependent serine protease